LAIKAFSVLCPPSSVLRPLSSVLHLSRCTNKTFEICKFARALVLVVVAVVDDAGGLGLLTRELLTRELLTRRL
jgi:hypothetical protein